jgi:hypothetical protein
MCYTKGVVHSGIHELFITRQTLQNVSLAYNFAIQNNVCVVCSQFLPWKVALDPVSFPWLFSFKYFQRNTSIITTTISGRNNCQLFFHYIIVSSVWYQMDRNRKHVPEFRLWLEQGLQDNNISLPFYKGLEHVYKITINLLEYTRIHVKRFCQSKNK